MTDEQQKAVGEHEILLHLNVAACHLKLNNSRKAIDTCKYVLGMDKNNVKAFYRMGQAFMQLGEFDEAIQKFETILASDPENAGATTQIARCKQSIKLQKKKERAYSANLAKKMSTGV